MSDTPIYDQLARERARERLTVHTGQRVTKRQKSPTRLRILNDGTGVQGSLLWNA